MHVLFETQLAARRLKSLGVSPHDGHEGNTA